MAAERGGTYGFRLICPEADDALPDLVAVPSSAPEVRVFWRPAAMISDCERVEDGRVVLGSKRGAGFDAHRDPLSIEFWFPEPVETETIVHPLLTIPMSVLARWRGDVTLHAGAFAVKEGAWAVVGQRQAGKSTMLAILGERGCPLVADDLLALSDDQVWAGPNCVDLRPDIAARIDGARHIGTVGGRDRYRLSTAPSAWQLPLRGMLILAWSEDGSLSLEPVAPAERLRLLYGQEYIGLMGATDPRKVLALMDIPAWQLTRPRDWSANEAAVDQVLALVAEHA
jgi:hypothetical protein